MSYAFRIILWSLVATGWYMGFIHDQLAAWWIFIFYLMTGGHYTFYLIWHSFPRDMRCVVRVSFTEWHLS